MTTPDDTVLLTVVLPNCDAAKMTRGELPQAIAGARRAAAEENAAAERLERRWREKRRGYGGEA